MGFKGKPNSSNNLIDFSLELVLVTKVISTPKLTLIISSDNSGKAVISRIPIVRLPALSKFLRSIPQKSRVRGKVMLISLSIKSAIFLPRRVTFKPTTVPSRSLKPAMDFLALQAFGF